MTVLLYTLFAAAAAVSVVVAIGLIIVASFWFHADCDEEETE